jgi:molybdopterin synthase catalytic subunit
MPFLCRGPIETKELTAELARTGDGALAVFLGVVRDLSAGRAVEGIEYSAYEPMAELEIAAIAAEILAEIPGARLEIRHRLGHLRVGETSVAIAAAAPHREEAFRACREAIERLKKRVPIWKKEFGPDGSSWVEPQQ